MNIDHKLALELKRAGFPQNHLFEDGRDDFVVDDPHILEEEWEHFVDPTLEELIDVCLEELNDGHGDNPDGFTLWRFNRKWRCGVPESWGDNGVYGKVNGSLGKGKTPSEAVARLFLSLKGATVEGNGKREKEGEG